MFRKLYSLGYHGSKSAAYNIIYAIKDLAQLTATDDIEKLDVLIDTMAKALMKSFSYECYAALGYETQAIVNNLIAKHLYTIAKNSSVYFFANDKPQRLNESGIGYSKWGTFFNNRIVVVEIRFPIIFFDQARLIKEIKTALVNAVSYARNEPLLDLSDEKLPDDIFEQIREHFTPTEREERSLLKKRN